MVARRASCPRFRKLRSAIQRSVLTFPNDDDCGIFWVATDPVFQGRGFAKAAMTAALKGAVEDGFHTTSLQASKAGAPLYRHLGYEDLGRSVNLWEHRVK